MFLGILYFSGVLAILTQLNIAQYISLKGSLDDGYSGVFVYGNCFPFLNHKLNSTPFESRAVVATEDCIEACTVSHRCRSINLKAVPEKDKKFICQLLESDKFNSTDLFAASLDFHHYSFVAPCERNPCKNGGTCVPDHQKYEYKCACVRSTKGSHCDKFYQSCAELRDVGVTESGRYMIQDQHSDSGFYVYCDQEHIEGGWTMVFKAVSGVGSDVYQLWSASNGLFEEKIEALNVNSSFRNHYKNRLVNRWQTVAPKEARVALYKDGSELFSIVFNASNSNNENWFTKNRVISSPWTDLKSNLPTYFSIPGAAGRRFYVHGPHPGCDGDYGWLSITQHHCTYETSLPSTSFIYSRLQTKTNWNTQKNVGVADVLVVYIR